MKSTIRVCEILESVFDEMFEGLQIIGRDWRYLYVNETVAKHGRTTKERLTGRTMMEVYPGIENTELFIHMKKSMEEKINIQMENEFTYPDGHRGWFELFIHPCSEGILIMSVDITSRKQAEQKLADKINQVDGLLDLAAGKQKEIIKLKEIIQDIQGLMPVGPRVTEQ